MDSFYCPILRENLEAWYAHDCSVCRPWMNGYTIDQMIPKVCPWARKSLCQYLELSRPRETPEGIVWPSS